MENFFIFKGKRELVNRLNQLFSLKFRLKLRNFLNLAFFKQKIASNRIYGPLLPVLPVVKTKTTDTHFVHSEKGYF